MVRTLKYSLLMVCMLVTTGGIASAQKEPSPAAAESTPPSPQQQLAASPQTQSAPENNDRLPFMAQTELNTKEAAPSVTGLLFRTVGALLLIVGLIVAVAWCMKRFAGARFGSPKEDAPQLALLNSLSLGDRRSLAVIRFGSRTLLIGSTSQNVTLLAEDEIEDFSTATPRSVADFLNAEDQPVEFAEQLALASDQLSEQLHIGGDRQI